MKKILTRLSSILLLVTIVISAISMSGHVFAQTDRQNQNNIVDVETDENQNTKVTLQSSEESLEPTAGKTADSEQTETSEENTQKETTENIESEENTTDSEAQQNSEENSNEQPESSLFSDSMRPSDTLTAGSLEIEDTRSLSKYDTINTLKDFTYTVSFSNLTPEKIYKYQTTSNIKYFTAESNGTATLQIVLRANQKVTFSDVANASYKITTSENATSAASYTAIAGDGALKKTSDQAEKGSTLSSEMETVSATSGTAFTFKHQFYYNFIIDSIVKSASTISLSAHLAFPASMKGQSIQIEGTSNSVTVGDDAAADMPIVNDQKMILSNISSSDIDQMYDSSELISIPDVPGYTSSLTKHIEDNGDITANISYKEYGYQIIYHGNGADDELTETVVDDDIQNTYSFSTKDTINSHYLYVDLTRNGNTMNYKITLSPIGIMYLKNREGTITVNGVKKSVILNAPSGEITEIDSGSFEINDTGDTYFSCRVEAKKTHIMTSNWTADFGNHKLGTRTKYEVSKIIDELTYSEVKNLHANPYKKTGYLFAGWNTKADGTGTGYTETQEVSKLAATDKDEDSIDLYAQWTPIKYSVKYSGNGATVGSMSNSSYTYDQTGNLAQNQFEKNYTLTFNHNYPGSTDSTLISKCKFSGWNGSDEKKYADKATVKNLTSKNNDVITMTAQWTPASVTLPSPSRDGYTFDGWYSAASGGKKVGSAGDSITPESNETYYANWTANNYTYKIRYVSSSGKLLGEDTVSGNFDSERTVTPLSKNGYTTPAVQKVVFDSVSAKTITFTYEPVKYSITYDLQGGSATGNPASYTIESSAITLNAPSKPKHDFTGWSGTGILGKQTAVTIPAGSTGNKTYTANWHSNEVTYTVKYVSSSGLSLGTSSITGTIGTSSKVSAPSKNGYTVPATQTVAFEDASKTVTFTYVPIEYTITCDVNGGNPLSNQKTAYNIESSAITLPLPTCKGMEFTGWTGSNGTDPQKTVTIAKGSTGNRSYKANWRANTYTITIHPNNGTLNISDESIKKNSDGSATATVTYNSTNYYALGVSASRTGYTATGLYTATSGGTKLWNNGGNCLQDNTYWSSSNTWIYAGNIDLYPQWKANTYTVSYNGNGATGGSTANSSHTYDSAKALTANGYRRNGYTFAGWTTNADGSGTVYGNRASVKNLTSANGGTVTLYAKWNAKSGTINYIAGNGGTLNRGAETATGTNKAVGATATPKAGYSFDGWHGDSGEKISSSATLVPGTPTAFNGFAGNYYGGTVAYDATNKLYNVTASATSMNSSWGSGTSFSESDDIPYGKWYIASFEIWSPVDATVVLDVNNYARGTSWSGNDNDANRKQSGFGNLTAGTWKKVMFAYQNANTKNTEKIAIYDVSGIGIKYDTSKGNQTFRIRNVQTMIADSYIGSADCYTAKFNINNYSISYDLGGGSVTGNPSTYTVETADFTLKNPAKTGHTFTGWSGTGISGTSTDVKVAKGSTGNRSYKANWSVNNYVLDLNGILDGSSSGGIAEYGTADVYINGVLKADDVSDFCQKIPYGSTYEIKDIKATAGHVYAGTDQALKGTMGTSRINIALKFNTKKTTVNFMRNYNSSDAAKSSETYTYGVSNQSFSNRGYSRTGYTLLGWAESQTATKETYPVNCGVASSWIDAHYPSINLYAVWSKNSYSISYNLNGGTVSGNPETYQVDTAEITLKNPTKTGYTFLGWSGTGITGTSKEVKIPKGSTENRSYTANWKINQYDIVIKGDRGTESITYGGKTYPLTATKSVTIHADYGTNTNVTYKVKKGFHIVSETGQSMSNTQQTWTNNSNKEGSTGGQTWTTCAFTRTITVNTAANKFVLNYEGNTGEGTMNDQTVTNGSGQKATLNAYKKSGYTFKNWNTKADGTGKSYPDGVAVDDIEASNGETVNMYAIYRPNVLTFHFYANGGDTYRSTPNEKTHNVTADEKANKTEIALTQNVECMKYDQTLSGYGIIDSQRLSKTGYISTNKWHAVTANSTVLLNADSNIYSKTQDIAEAAGILQKLEDGDTDINLYADWTAIKYKIVFNANNGEGIMAPLELSYDTSGNLPQNTFTRSKHRFMYWTENADGSGKKYTDKANVKNLTATANGTVTLYAQWEKLTDLKVGATVSGNMGSRAKEFEFHTSFPACFQNKKFTVIKGDGSKETVTIGADGTVKFSLKHGETFTITDLDTEQVNAIQNLTGRCINELDYRTEGYTTTHAASVESDGTLRVDFNNAKSSGVPTGIHNSSGTMWMMIFGFVGMIFAISSFFRKKHQKS